MMFVKRLLMSVTVFAFFAFTSVRAAEAMETGKIKTTFAAGATLTEGNSDTLLANASMLLEGKRDGLGSFRSGVDAGYGETRVDGQDEKTIENVSGFIGVENTLTEKTFVSIHLSALYDSIAEVDYRVILSPSLGIHLYQDNGMDLLLEAGPGYIWEEVSDIRDDYMTVRFAERFEYVLTETSKIWQSAEYMPRADDFKDYLLHAELGAEAALNAHLSLRMVFKNSYDSTPAAGLEKNDISLIAGISVSI